MKFLYKKKDPCIVTSDSYTTHIWQLEGHEFFITADCAGVSIRGTSPLFQPVDEERKIPEDFREFFVRLADAFEISFKEQQIVKKEIAARQAILGAM